MGNRQARTVSSLPLAAQSFSFDANDRLGTDTYDADGNTLLGAGFGQAAQDQYDFENRLVQRQATLSGGATTITVRYDGDGQRVGKTVATATNSVTTYYVVDELNPTGYAQVLEELTATTSAPTPVVTRVYTYGHARLAQDRLAGSQWIASLYGYDGHNSVRYLTDLDGIVTDTYDYDAFGNLIAQVGSTPNAYLFTGEQYDADLGLYYLRARYHNPDTGRFWSQDSFEGTASDPTSLHKYAYAGNDPVNAYDPSGNSYEGLTGQMFAGNLSLTARALYTGIGASVGATTSTLDLYVASRGQATPEQYREAAKNGAMLGAAFGFGLPLLGPTLGPTLGGAALGASGMAGIGDAFLKGDYTLMLFRGLTLGLGTSIGSRQMTLAMEEYYTPNLTVDLFGGSRSQIPGAINVNLVATHGLKSSVTSLPFADKTVNIAVASGPRGVAATEYLPEVARVLIPNGRVYINATQGNKYAKLPTREFLKTLKLEVVVEDGPILGRFLNQQFRRTEGSVIPSEAVRTTILQKTE